MLDYVVRNSSLANGYARGAGINPLQTLAAANEPEHPNFMKKYAGKKVSVFFSFFSERLDFRFGF